MPDTAQTILQMNEGELAAEIARYVEPYGPDVSTSRAVLLLRRASALLGQVALRKLPLYELDIDAIHRSRE